MFPDGLFSYMCSDLHKIVPNYIYLACIPGQSESLFLYGTVSEKSHDKMMCAANVAPILSWILTGNACNQMTTENCGSAIPYFKDI